MIYKEKQIVTIADSDGKLVSGEIMSSTDTEDSVLWWVKYEDRGITEVGLFSESQLDEYNVTMIDDYCVCGSVAVGSPGHAYYCRVK